jgi:UDP-glucose 4-epimerase
MDIESRFRGKKILITGARGYIGSHLCRKLAGYDVELHGTSRGPADDPADRIKWWYGSMVNFGFTRKVIRSVRPDYIFHLSGFVSGKRDLKYLPDLYNSLLSSTVNLLTVVTEIGCEKVVVAGSLEEPDDEDPHPGSPYAAAKAGCRIYTRLFANLYGTPVVNPRIFMVYGPGQTDFRKLIPYVISSLLKDEAPELASGTREK